MTNLIQFWSVQPASGVDPHIFLSEEEAMEQSLKWRAEVEERFAAWERGESYDSSIVHSTVEGDGFGGVKETFTIADHALPGGVCHRHARTQSKEKWEDCPGCEKIVWGNPAH